MDLLFVTSNEHKVREVMGILPENLRIYGLKDIGYFGEIPETQHTIEGNSLQKAQLIWDLYGKSCFAEDTGLVVPSLNGAPGVYSARYAGLNNDADANMDKLLDKLEDKSDRSAYFKTVVTFIDGGKVEQFTGILHGEIANEKAGNGGFGYDPIFLISEGKTLAEIGDVEKNKISHRSKAIQELVKYLKVNYL